MKQDTLPSQLIPPRSYIVTPRRFHCLLILSVFSVAVFMHWLGLFPSALLPGLSKQPLHFSADRTFQISIFSDLHYGEDEHSFGPAQDIKSAALMRQVLATERPNLVVLNGDLITGENTFAFNSTAFIDQIVAPLNEGNYIWASTYGNHDSKFNLSRESLFAAESKHPNALTQHGPPGTDGVTNYVLPIYPPLTNPPTPHWWPLRNPFYPTPLSPLALLYFFDSRGGASYQHDPPNADDIPNHVSLPTAHWFRQTSLSLRNRYGPLPSLAFVHIPLLPFLDLQISPRGPNVSGPHYPGMNADVPVNQQGYSNTGEEAMPFMRALLETEGLHSVYSGHDHGDSWCGRWPNSTIPRVGVEGQMRPFCCFCKHSGYGGYGRWSRGVRQVRLRVASDGGVLEVETWVRMEAGEVITRVSLNDTYGEDVYGVDDGGYRDDWT